MDQVDKLKLRLTWNLSSSDYSEASTWTVHQFNTTISGNRILVVKFYSVDKKMHLKLFHKLWEKRKSFWYFEMIYKWTIIRFLSWQTTEVWTALKKQQNNSLSVKGNLKLNKQKHIIGLHIEDSSSNATTTITLIIPSKPPPPNLETKKNPQIHLPLHQHIKHYSCHENP